MRYSALLLASCLWSFPQFGCDGPSGTGGVGLELTLSRALAIQASKFQVAIVSKGRDYDCQKVQTDCLRRQVDLAQLVEVTDALGKRQKAVRFSSRLSEGNDAGTPRTQDVVIEGIAVGKNYAVVIEALSFDTPPKLLGSSCNYVEEIRAGSNDRLIANPMATFPTPVDCDPTL